MADSKNLDQKIIDLKVYTRGIVDELNNLRSAGTDANKVFDKMNSKIKFAFEEISSLSKEVSSAFKDNKDQEAYIKNLQAISTEFAKVESAQSKVLKATAKEEQKILKQQENLRRKIAAGNKERTKKVNDFQTKQARRRADVLAKIEKRKEAEERAALKRRERIQKAWEKRREQRLKEAAARQKRILDNIEKEELRKFKLALDRLKRREDVQKAWDKRRADRSKQYARNQKRILDNVEKEEIGKFKARISRIKQEEKAAAKEASKRDFRGGFASQLTPRAIGGALGSLTKYLGIYQLLNGAISLFNELTIGSAKAAIEFQKSLANLSAVAGVSGDKVKILGANAKEVAAQTKFSATEVVGLQTELAKLGFTYEQIISSTQAVAFASQALGSSLAETASTFGKLINQFGLIAEQSEYVGDVIVTTINRSALSFDGFNTAIQYIGPIADQLGFSLEQTAGAMAVLADSGFTASRVGTGLRGILTEIGKTSFDAKGELNRLADAHIGLSEAIELVGKRNAAQLLVLLKNIDAIDENNDKYYEAGRALESAATQTDTFDGKLKILQSTIKNFQISIGDAVAESGLFNTLLSAMSEEAGRTVEGLKAVKGVADSKLGFDAFLDSAKRVSSGFDSLQESIELLRATGQITQEQFDRLSSMSYDEIGAFINDSREGYLLWGGSARKENMELAASVQGLREQLEGQSDVLLRQDAIARGTEKGNADWKSSVDEITSSYESGNDIIEESDVLYEQIQARVEELSGKLKENSEASALNKTLTEQTALAYKGEVKSLENLLNVLANVSAANKERIKNTKEVQKARKFELDAYEAEIEALDEQYDRLEKLNELQGDEVSSGAALLIINKSKTEIYDEMISRLNATKDAINGEVSATDSSTEAGKKKIEVHKKEIAQLDKLIKKYQDQRGELNENSGVLEQIFAQGQKDLKASADSDQSVDLKIDEQTSIINRISEQLLEAAGENDPQLKQLAEAYIASLSVNIGEVENKEGDKLNEKIKERQRKLFEDITKYASDAAKEYNQTQLENTKNRLNAEIDAIKERYATEEQILKSQLDNQLITDSQYRTKQNELKKKQLAEENEVNKQIFQAQKKADQQNVVIETVEAIASNAIQNYKSTDAASATLLTAAGYAAITASGAAKLDAIRRRKFYPVKFEQGGLVEGPSHSEGGVPFTVQGQPGYEMEGGEFIVNKKASSLHRQLLESINNSVKPNAVPQPQKFATGGIVQNNTTINNNALESVNYLKAIAEATTSSAISSRKPVRAFVSERDLRTSENERRLKERNDRI